MTNPALTSTTTILPTHSIGNFLSSTSNNNYINYNNSPLQQQRLTTSMKMFHPQQPLIVTSIPEIFAKICEHPKLPPPQGMDEQKYIKITNYDKSCEICGNCDPGSSKFYWEFRVRCCDKCLLERTKT